MDGNTLKHLLNNWLESEKWLIANSTLGSKDIVFQRLQVKFAQLPRGSFLREQLCNLASETEATFVLFVRRHYKFRSKQGENRTLAVK